MRLRDLAAQINGRVDGDADALIYAAAPFELAKAGGIAVASSAKYIKNLAECRATAIIVPENYTRNTEHNLVFATSPMAAFADAVRILTPPRQYYAGVHPSAIIGDNSSWGENVSIGPYVVIGVNVSIGANAKIMAGVFIGNDVIIGDDVLLHPNVAVLDSCQLGDRVIVNAGTVIGSDGFGFAPDKQGFFHKILHLGNVCIGSDVEIGANAAIDRATFGSTIIGNGAKLDNLVHVAHNVSIGDNSVIAAQGGIAGSTSLGRNVMFGGQVGVGGHIQIADRVMVGATAAIAQSIEEAGAVYMGGIPAMPQSRWLRFQRIARQLPELKAKVDKLERMLAEFKGTEDDGE